MLSTALLILSRLTTASLLLVPCTVVRDDMQEVYTIPSALREQQKEQYHSEAEHGI